MIIFETKIKPNGEKQTSFRINKDAVPIVIWIVIALLVIMLILLGVSAGDVSRILGAVKA